MLTKKQHRLLTFIAGYIKENGYSPSFENMQKGIGIKSKSGIHHLLNALVDRGFVQRIAGRSRAVEVIRMPGDVAPPLCALEVTERAKADLGFSGIQFVINPAVPEGEIWVSSAYGKKFQKFAVGA